MFEFAVFWIFAAILVIAASCVITVRNPVHSALFLVLAFFTAAALWMLLRAEFLAIALVLVYVGAVMVLFLFVVMVVEMVLVLSGRYFGIEALPGPRDPGPGASNTKELGRVLYTDYAYPLELAAVLLLVAIVVAIALTLRKRKDTKYQDPVRQVAVKRSDRVRLVSMPSEKND